MRSNSLSVLFAFMTLAFVESVRADIIIVERESRGRNRVFAGSGGASELGDTSVLKTDLTGAFSFADTFAAAVTPADTGSNGAANAQGALTITDQVTQASALSLSLSATRNSSGSAAYGSGTGNATSSQRQTFRVRFQVTDTPVSYSLTGVFDPGSLDDVTTLQLHRPFTTQKFVDIDSFATLNESGTLQPGNTYELFIRLIDSSSASAGNVGPNSDASSFNVQFSATSVPEPSATLLLPLGCVCVLLRRSRNSP